MGQLIDLSAHRRRRCTQEARTAGSTAPQPVDVHFEIGSPWTYLLAERADRALRNARWRPVLMELGDDAASSRADAAARAAHLGMPFVWPDARRGGGRSVMRVAHFAAERGLGGRFVLAASRLAYCGGFDLDDPLVLADAVAAACLDPDEALAAAGDGERDVAMHREGCRLAALGVEVLPAFEVGGRVLCGESQLAAAIAAAESRSQVRA